MHTTVNGGIITTTIIGVAAVILLLAGLAADSNRLFYSGLITLSIAATAAAVTASIYTQRTSLRQIARIEEFDTEMFGAAHDELARRRNRRYN